MKAIKDPVAARIGRAAETKAYLLEKRLKATGWGAPTGTASRATFDTATATTADLAQRLKALIDDLTTMGVLRL